MSTGKAKVIFTIGEDAYKVGLALWKKISGSAHVKRIPSNSAAAKNAKNLPNVNAAQTKINTARLQQGLKQQDAAKTAEKLKRAGEKIDLKTHPSLKSGKPSGAAGSKTKPINGRRKTKVDKKVEPETISQVTRKGVVSKVIPKGTKKGGFILNPRTGKPFTKKAWLLAGGGAAAWGTYVAATSGKKINGAATTSSGAATTTKPPKQPLVPPSVYPPPKKKPPVPSITTTKPKPPKADYPGAGLTTTEDEADRPNVAKPKTFEQKLKDKFVKFRGGEDAFGKKGSEGAWKTHVLDMRRGSEVGLTYKDQQDYDKIIEERKGTTKKKRGGVIKRNKGGPVRGVGKALRGYGNNSIYSNKMY